MIDVEEHDGFDQARAAVSACSLDACGAQAQKTRFRAMAPFITRVREEATTVVLEFAEDVDAAAVDEAIAVEHECCAGVLDFEFDRPARCLRVSATDPGDRPALELVAAGFRTAADTRDASSQGRRIGAIGTAIRILAGFALLILAYLNKPAGLVGGLQLHDLLLGLIALPAASLTVGLLAGLYADGPLRFGGAAGTAVNFGVLTALFSDHYTAGAAALYYGATLLVAAWRGQAGCEFTLLSNLILGREDVIGCPVFTPIDALEMLCRRAYRPSAGRRDVRPQ
jgi:hypothetical protein